MLHPLHKPSALNISKSFSTFSSSSTIFHFGISYRLCSLAFVERDLFSPYTDLLQLKLVLLVPEVGDLLLPVVELLPVLYEGLDEAASFWLRNLGVVNWLASWVKECRRKVGLISPIEKSTTTRNLIISTKNTSLNLNQRVPVYCSGAGEPF